MLTSADYWTWSLKLWLKLMKLECLFMWMKYNNIQKTTLEWIFQKSSDLSKLEKDYKLLNVSRNNEEKEESDVGCASRFVIMLT